MTGSPLIPTDRKKKRLAPYVIAGGVALLIILIVGAVFAVKFVSEHDFTKSMDKKFGDQNLKSAVATLELHKVRFGKYPDSLRDLKYTGDWDQLWINGTSYYPSDDRQSYYVEVHRGWVGKPALVMPEEFWQNTGYDESLKPKKE